MKTDVRAKSSQRPPPPHTPYTHLLVVLAIQHQDGVGTTLAAAQQQQQQQHRRSRQQDQQPLAVALMIRHTSSYNSQHCHSARHSRKNLQDQPSCTCNAVRCSASHDTTCCCCCWLCGGCFVAILPHISYGQPALCLCMRGKSTSRISTPHPDWHCVCDRMWSFRLACYMHGL